MNKLKISPEAKNDLIEIKNYISLELNSPKVAVKLTSRIIDKMRGLLIYPEIGASLSSIIEIQTDYRFLVCENYLIFYRYQDEIIYIIRILYGRRDYMHVLFRDLPEKEER